MLWNGPSCSDLHFHCECAPSATVNSRTPTSVSQQRREIKKTLKPPVLGCNQCSCVVLCFLSCFYSGLSVKCSICKSVSDTYDPYLDIAVEIRVRSSGPDFIFLGKFCLYCDVVSIVSVAASGKHCASFGTVRETRRAEWRERLHVRQVSDVFPLLFFLAGVLHINQCILQIIQG